MGPVRQAERTMRYAVRVHDLVRGRLARAVQQLAVAHPCSHPPRGVATLVAIEGQDAGRVPGRAAQVGEPSYEDVVARDVQENDGPRCPESVF